MIGVSGGVIGREVGALARGLGMRAMAHDPFVECADGVILADLDTVLASSDVVSLHVPPTPGSSPSVLASWDFFVPEPFY